MAMRLERDGTMSVIFMDGRSETASLGREAFEATSTIAASTYLPLLSLLCLRTTRGDDLVVEVPRPSDLAPLRGRPSIYLDQNHWSTLTNAMHEPNRITDEREYAAAKHLIELAVAREVVLPMSSAHISETCKQADPEQRYRRGLTIAQLSAGWQLRDPLDLRQFEIRQALTTRYRHTCLIPPAAVTLEPNAIHAGRDTELPDVAADLPLEAQWIIHALRCIGGTIDTMLDTEHIPMPLLPGWADGFQRFAEFLRDNPTGREIRRRRTHAKFIADLSRELAEAAHHANITPDEMSDWAQKHSDEDMRFMPSLGLFREVLHEKLSNGELRWRDNDLIDMLYLTPAAGYCDHVVGERAHTSHIANGIRRLNQPAATLHCTLRSLSEQLK